MPKQSRKKKVKKQLKKKLNPITQWVKHHPRVSLSMAVVLISIIGGLIYFTKDLPSPTKLQSNEFPVSTQIFDRNGTLLYEIFADTYRTPIKLETLPEHVTQATIAIEDQSFYNHFGFSVQGIARAVKNNLFNDNLQGGSTITQQLIKTALLTPERTIDRKIREAILTLLAEVLYTKDQILEMYLNHIPYGGTAYGIEAAARRYFQKPATGLTLEEAALLAGLPQAPTYYSPFTNPDRAKARQHEVLRRMIEDGYITQEEADTAFETPLHYAPPTTDIKAPHFVFYVKDLLEKEYGLQTVERGGLRVTTTLDLSLQERFQATVSAEIESLKNYRVTNGAALVTKPNTGEILAMVGSKDYFDPDYDGQVNLTTRHRQPGSSIKPLNYVTAFETKRLHPASLILDIPTCFQVTGQPSYCPRNYDGSFHGPTDPRAALANSYNIPAVKTLALNGLDSMIATASAMGISTFSDPSRYGLSLTLGGGEVTMLDMATAFGTLANQGIKVPLNPILKITDHTGQTITQNSIEQVKTDLSFFFENQNPEHNIIGRSKNQLARVLHREPAYLITDILSDNQARTPAFGPRSALYIDGKAIAAKTGTTNDLKDNWTIGYTPEHLVTTWVGNNDNTPMNSFVVSGVTGAAPIFNDLMSFLTADYEPVHATPSGIITQAVCQLSGEPADGNCSANQELFWDQNPPQKNEYVTRKNIWVDKETGQPAFVGTQTGSSEPAEGTNLDNLELVERTVISDPFTQEFCLDCPAPPESQDPNNQDQLSTRYPTVNVDMTLFRQAQTPSIPEYE